DISGLAGSGIGLDLEATKSLQKATLLLESGEMIPLDRSGDGLAWHTSFRLWSKDAKSAAPPADRLVVGPTRYQIKLDDSDGYENADPLWHSITLTKDQPPTGTITAPGRDLQVKPGATVDLSVECRDDYGVGDTRILYRVNDEQSVRELKRFIHDGKPAQETADRFQWSLSSGGLKPGDLVQYWATAGDRNTITGPGHGESRRFTIFLLTPEIMAANLDLHIQDFAQVLEELIRLQRENRAQTASGVAFETLVIRESLIRTKTRQLARAMEKDALPIATMIKSLDDLVAG